MPELPEVETVRRGLESLVLGATIESSLVFRDSCVRRHPGGVREFDAALRGRRIVSAVRRGKFMWLIIDSDDDAAPMALSAHLGMSGQFRVFDSSAPEPHGHCRARLNAATGSGGEALTIDFLDQRTFGYLYVEPLVDVPDGAAGGQGSSLPAVPASVSHIARDALDPALDGEAVFAAWSSTSRAIKTTLLDQQVLSGVGNIYADEALWRARIHPATPASSLGAPLAALLLASCQAVMSEALAQGGTSFDALYVNVNGESGQLNIALKRVEVSRRQVISQSDLVRQALTKRLESPTCSAAHRRSFGSRSLRGASHA